MEKAQGLYKKSFLFLAFIIASPFYEFSFGALSICFILWMYYKDYKNLPQNFLQPQVLLPVLFYVYILIAFFFSDNFGRGLSSLSTRLPFLIFPLIISSTSVIDRKLIESIMVTLLLTTLFFLMLALGYAIFDVLKTKEKYILIGESIYNKYMGYGLTRLYSNWHPTNITLSLNFSGFFLLLNYSKIGSVRTKAAAMIILIFMAIFIFLLNSLAGIFIFSGIFFFFFFKKILLSNIKTYLKIIILPLILLAGICIFFYNPFQNEKIESLKQKEITLTDVQEDRNLLTIRLAKWDTYLDLIKERPIWGTTLGDLENIRKEKYIEKGYLDLAKHNYNAHNMYFEIAVAHGIIGLILFLLILFIPMFTRNFHEYYIPFFIIFCLVCLTESILNRQQGIIFFFFFYSLLTYNLRRIR